MEPLQDLIVGLRRFRAEHQISPKIPIEIRIEDPEKVMEEWWADHLAGLAAVSIVDGPVGDEATSRVVAGPVEAFVTLEGLVDVDAERDRLAKAVSATNADLERAAAKLDNPSFRDRAPSEVVAAEESKADEARARLDKLEAQLVELGLMS
jgi:valyl-tRNA synthetase